MSFIRGIYTSYRDRWYADTRVMSNPFVIIENENAQYIIKNKDLFLEFILEELEIPSTFVFLVYAMFPHVDVNADPGNISDMCDKWSKYLNSLN